MQLLRAICNSITMPCKQYVTTIDWNNRSFFCDFPFYDAADTSVLHCIILMRIHNQLNGVRHQRQSATPADVCFDT